MNSQSNFKLKFINPLWWILYLVVYVYRFFSKFFPSRCRFVPTCSSYAQEAIREYGVLKSSYLIVKRVSKCHPFHPGGFDYVPLKSSTEQVKRENNTYSNDESSK